MVAGVIVMVPKMSPIETWKWLAERPALTPGGGEVRYVAIYERNGEEVFSLCPTPEAAQKLLDCIVEE